MGKKSAIMAHDVIFTNYMITDNDTDLFKKVKLGDEKAFELLFKSFYQKLCNYACNMLKDIEEAEEIVQKVFINIWEKREHIEIETSLKSYLYRSVNNTCLNKIKQNNIYGLHHQIIKVSQPQSEDSTNQQMESSELGTAINEAVALLPEQCRLVFQLSRFEGMKHIEIAEQLGISPKTVENHIGKALKILRDQLKNYLNYIVLISIIYKNI